MKPSLKTTLMAVLSLFIGVALTAGLIWHTAPSMMLIEDKSPYSFDETIARLEKNVIERGWKIATVHDLQQTMNKFNKDVAPAKVYELCHPEHAYKILSKSEERVVTSLMPCRVSVYVKEDGATYLSRMNSGLMGKMMIGVVPEVMDIAYRESEEIIKMTLR